MKSIMFVCKQNSCRSQMAEGFARTLGENQVNVTSSGLGKSEVNPTAIAVMQEIGIDISEQFSKPLSDFQADNYQAVISLCGCGVNLPSDWLVRDIFEDWQVDDPAGESIATFRRVRDEIKAKVIQLLEQL